MSAGNHAQAVAYHAKRLGIPATIVMPLGTPLVKAENTRAHGARVILHGDTLADSAEKAEALADAEGLVFVHPYDDAAVMAGQGTIALEMLADAPNIDQLVVPIGGGGLISGIAVAAKAINPEIEIVGVEAALYPSFTNAIRGSNQPIGGATLAEGIAVKTVGQRPLPIVRDLVSDIVLVDEPALERAVNAYATLQRTMAEGAGAAGLAAMLAAPERFHGRRVGLVLCGGNIDARLLASVMVRELERDDRIASFRVTTNDRPGLTRSQYPGGVPRPPLPRRARQGRHHRRDGGNPRRPPHRGGHRSARRRRPRAAADHGLGALGDRVLKACIAGPGFLHVGKPIRRRPWLTVTATNPASARPAPSTRASPKACSPDASAATSWTS
jgi:threonine dehydratase